MNIQRYGPVWTGDESCSIAGNATGEYVTYADHVAAIEHLERIHRNEINELRWFNQVTREDSFIAGFREAVQECILIANHEDFIHEDGNRIWAASALLNVINKIGALNADSHYGK